MTWWIIAILAVVTLVLSIANATRIENIRTEISDLDTRGYESSRSESMLMRNGTGSYMPKKAYWIKADVGQPEPLSDGSRKLKLVQHAKNDFDDLLHDVTIGRITHVYRPDQREMFSIKKDGDLVVKNKVEGSATTLVPPGLNKPKMITLIGVPDSTTSSEMA
nr:hypothetical protein TetV2_00540 [Oceanusvirus sp.]